MRRRRPASPPPAPDGVPPSPRPEGVVPLEDEATGYLPVAEGEDAYDALRLPHERDESVDPPPGTPRGRRRTR